MRSMAWCTAPSLWIFPDLPAHHNEMQAHATIVGARRQIRPQGTRGSLPERARCGEGGHCCLCRNEDGAGCYTEGCDADTGGQGGQESGARHDTGDSAAVLQCACRAPILQRVGCFDGESGTHMSVQHGVADGQLPTAGGESARLPDCALRHGCASLITHSVQHQALSKWHFPAGRNECWLVSATHHSSSSSRVSEMLSLLLAPQYGRTENNQLIWTPSCRPAGTSPSPPPQSPGMGRKARSAPFCATMTTL